MKFNSIEKCADGEIPKDRLSILVPINMGGSENVKL